MASSLNLNPDLPIIGIQAGLFLANMFIVKKLMLEPYLKVRALRDQKTGGSQGDAEALLKQAAGLEQIISNKMRDAHKEAAAAREKIKSEAVSKRASVLSSAEQAAKLEQSEMEKAIAANLAEEKSKREQTVTSLTEEFIQRAIH